MAEKKRPPDEISETEAAELVGLAKRTLQNYRYLGIGPACRRFKHGKPRICYSRGEVQRWRRNGKNRG